MPANTKNIGDAIAIQIVPSMANNAITPSISSIGTIGSKKALSQRRGLGAVSGALSCRKPITSGTRNKNDPDMTENDWLSQTGTEKSQPAYLSPNSARPSRP